MGSVWPPGSDTGRFTAINPCPIWEKQRGCYSAIITTCINRHFSIQFDNYELRCPFLGKYTSPFPPYCLQKAWKHHKCVTELAMNQSFANVMPRVGPEILDVHQLMLGKLSAISQCFCGLWEAVEGSGHLKTHKHNRSWLLMDVYRPCIIQTRVNEFLRSTVPYTSLIAHAL